MDHNIYTFFKVLRDQGKELLRLLELTPYSEVENRKAKELILDKNLSDLKRAYYTFIIYQSSYSGTFNGGFSASKSLRHDNSLYFKNKINNKIFPCIERIKDCQILEKDALGLIDYLDKETSLFYLDPPYPEAYQAYRVNGFNIKDFNNLTKKLSKIKGRFLLSFYQIEGMELYDFKLHYQKTLVKLSGLENKKRTECLATNYD